ncbi:PREDICTED: sentrin-specific protease 7 isoform X1 [Cyprinodon variegatus]|uniref:Si:dkey-100n23.3 n=2 Tax=Cyprinodon variegatus TaxID=28743 RepID=A0A3Q2GK80_CYPVA|nr:PREDICTED: sentrin-specific protease 7 isoform X1 [Cyprinodon variegatus]
MMERRRALTIPFVDKDKLMENPLKISVACLSSECGKLDGQVPWTAFADHNGSPNHKPRHKNGSTVFDCNRAALKSSDIMRRKPRLVLTDVLKTELGKDYIKRLKNRSNVRRLSGLRKVDNRRKEEELCYSETRSRQMEEKNKSKDITPKGKKRTPTSKRLLNRLRKPQNTEEEDDEESQGTKEMKISKESEGDETFAEVVDCGLSLSWQSTGDTSACDGISADFNKDKLTGSEEDADHCLAMKRKRRNPGLQCNGKSSPKRQRGSMLHPTGEAEKDGGRVPLCGVQEESDIDLDMERCIVQFTVGEEDGFQPLVPFYPGGKPEGIIISSRINSSPRNNSATQTSLSDPIVLSSDDEENREDPECRHRLGQNKASLFDTSIHRNASEEEESQQEMTSDTEDVQGMQMLVEEFPHSAPSSPIPEFDFPSLSVHFVAMYCGCYKLRADGCLMIAKNKIVIPLKGTSEQGFLTFVRTDLRRYSVWDKQELEAHHIRFEGEKDPSPPGVLLLYVSETAAGPIQQVLNQLCDSEDGPVDNGKASRFILLTLKDPVEGMEGALLRSLLDIDCINGMTYDNRFKNNDGVQPNSLLDSDSPVLSMDDSIKLIRNIGADSYLLSILCIKSPDSDLIVEKEPSDCDEEDLPTAHIWVDTNVEKDTEMPLEKKTEDGAAEAERNMDKEDEEPKTPSDSKKEEVVPVYTVCHQRRKGSYSVSLCKPDSNWIKYKHEGLSKRLIQFPPPPLKGGITVTMEDLQCLDSWQYLNDVIIDFYLKYLIQKSSAAISKRSHIFSSFFYKQLTRRDNASEGGSTDSCQRQRRHQRVKTWTRHVDIFEKDFLFVPVNQEAHWYLAMICFPGLEEPLQEDWLGESQGPDEAKECKSSDPAETLERLDPSDGVNTETENHLDESTKDPPPPCRVSCTEQTCRRRTVCKRPCILIMDSLKLSSHERICKLLREYLQSEWEVRRGSSREFGPDQLKSSHCIVPLQDNSSDCGLYLLQYVECFLKDPVVHFDLPLQLQKWFPRQVVRKKRDEIRDLILNLYRLQNLDSKNT